MMTPLDLLQILIAIITLPPGTVLNSFIVSVYFNLSRKKNVSACDQIFFSTALTSLVLQWFSILITMTFYVIMEFPRVGMIYLYVCVFLFCMSYFYFWNTAWLSIQYCLKLFTFSSIFWTWLKVKLSYFMSQVLVASLIWVFIISIPVYWTVTLDNANGTDHSGVTVNMECLVWNVLLGCVLPFIQTLICIGFSVMFLLRHVWRIRQNQSEFGSSPQVSGHVRAVRIMIVQVLLNTALQAAITGKTISAFFPTAFTSGTMFKEITEIILMTYPSAEALTIILGNPKLKSRLRRKLAIFYPK
ncbi:taste receptor type 2 member 40-like [Leptodactylus fuscus]|uniref:taste receptor type 2 member 40-like n=1 Tax=Leptodactylus fuscus TaxID=238119 RepID=UPI003F4E5AFB